MAKIKVKDICRCFEEILGWKYVSPGSNDENGIDCSGAFVRAYKKHGKSIYHGSNRIIRKHCHDVKQITSIEDLKPGMAIFKARSDLSKLSAQYKPGGAYYDASLPFDYYHVGQVVNANPLRIIHATPPNAKQDTAIGTWKWCGYLDEVDYSEAIEIPSETPIMASTGIVYADNGKPVKLRKQSNKASVWLAWVPVGMEVQVIE